MIKKKFPAFQVHYIKSQSKSMREIYIFFLYMCNDILKGKQSHNRVLDWQMLEISPVLLVSAVCGLLPWTWNKFEAGK